MICPVAAEVPPWAIPSGSTPDRGEGLYSERVERTGAN